MTHKIKITRKTRTGATVDFTLNGTTYSGQVTNPSGATAPDHWISLELLKGINLLSDSEFTEVCKTIRLAF
jgi:hypothetical protein